jgi:hypothetical protein
MAAPPTIGFPFIICACANEPPIVNVAAKNNMAQSFFILLSLPWFSAIL